MKVYFVSSNEHKIREVVEFLSDTISIEGYQSDLDEIQSESLEKIVRCKVLDAYKKVRRPVLVEHTGLYILNFGGLPGGLTQIFWDNLKADKVCDYFQGEEAKAVTMVGFCDGKRILMYSGEITGEITEKPKGNPAFQWDCVFQPKGYGLTFAEMEDKKKEISMRTQALKKIKVSLGDEYHV